MMMRFSASGMEIGQLPGFSATDNDEACSGRFLCRIACSVSGDEYLWMRDDSISK